MTPEPIKSEHRATILRNNQRFVHWLAPLNAVALDDLLSKADFARQCLDGEAVLIGYDAHSSYRHKNVDWICDRLDKAFYIDRVIIGDTAQGQGFGRILYEAVEQFARVQAFEHLACEVNTEPDNPGSHVFHHRLGFQPIGEVRYSEEKAVRYYAKSLHD